MFTRISPERRLHAALQITNRSVLLPFREAFPPEAIEEGKRVYHRSVSQKPYGFAISLAERFITAYQDEDPWTKVVVVADEEMDVATRRRKTQVLGASINNLVELDHTEYLYTHPVAVLMAKGLHEGQGVGLVVLVEPKTEQIAQELAELLPQAVIVTIKKQEQTVKYSTPKELTADMQRAVVFSSESGDFPPEMSFEERLYKLYYQHEAGMPYLTLEQIAEKLGQSNSFTVKAKIRSWLRACSIVPRESNTGYQLGAKTRGVEVGGQARDQIEILTGLSYEEALRRYSTNYLLSRLPRIGRTTIDQLREELDIQAEETETQLINRRHMRTLAVEKKMKAIAKHKARVTRALESIPQFTRDVDSEDLQMLKLRYVQEYAWDQIASSLDIPTRTVRRRVGQLVRRAERLTAFADVRQIILDHAEQRPTIKERAKQKIILFGSKALLEQVMKEDVDLPTLATYAREIFAVQRTLGNQLDPDFRVRYIDIARLLIQYVPPETQEWTMLNEAIQILEPKAS